MDIVLIILFLLVASIVFTRLRVIFRQYQCVEDENLRSYLYGKLKKSDPKEYEHLIAHLGLCEKCQERLHEISTGESTSDKNLEDHLVDP